MRDNLIAFIKEAAARQPPMIRLGATEGLAISFGRQYAEPGAVIVWYPDNRAEEKTVEEGVGAFLNYYGLEG